MYKVGDEVFIKAEITDVHPESERPYFVQPCYDSVNWVSKNKLYRCDGNYEQGLADAWDLVRKVYALELDEREKILGYQGLKPILEDLSPEYVADAIESYEKEKEIKVGDVIESRRSKRKFLIVTEEDDNSDYDFGVIDLETMMIDRICNDLCYYKKTGKHIDIESLLRQIGE